AHILKINSVLELKMKNLLIPFGIDKNTAQIIEPEDAVKGRSCNCDCPGCGAPLLSRHPRINRIHFAHDSKHPDALPDSDCPLSPMVALLMMLRHLAPRLIGELLYQNQYSVRVDFTCCNERAEFYPVLEKRSDKITSIEEGGTIQVWHY